MASTNRSTGRRGGSDTRSYSATAVTAVPLAELPLAILISGGLDSAVLLGESLSRYPAIHPLYVRSGLVWETAELRYLRRFLEKVHCPPLQPLQVLDLPVADLHGDHWSLTGRGVPDADSPEEAVFLPGRNVLLLTKAMLWCHLHGVPGLALAVLKANPFPDATAGFFSAFQEVVNQALGSSIAIQRPYAALSKAEVLRRGSSLPLELTFSCIHPCPRASGLMEAHCGGCNKCAERRRAFAAAGILDETEYAPVAQLPSYSGTQKPDP